MVMALEYWKDELEALAPATREAYLRDFNRFLERQGITAEELYTMQKEALTGEDPRDRRKVALIVRNYMKELLEEGYAPGSARNKVKPIASFFDANELDFKLKRRDKPKVVSDGQRFMRPDQIRMAFDSVGTEMKLRNRALIMLLKDSGLRVSDVANRNVGDYLEAMELLNEAGERFKVFQTQQSEKTGQNAFIHIGPEAIEALDKYLEERREDGELHLEAPLFPGRDGSRLSANGITSQMRRLCGHLKESPKVSAHSLCKFHRTMLESAGVLSSWIKKLQGRAANTYSRPEQTNAHPEYTDELTEAYIMAYDALRIHGPKTMSDVRQDTKIRDLEREIVDMREEMVAMAKMLRDNVIVIPGSDPAAVDAIISNNPHLLFLPGGKLMGGWNDKKRWEEEEEESPNS